jgi:hypothetical protein
MGSSVPNICSYRKPRRRPPHELAATCENRPVGYLAALSIGILAIVGCVLVFRKRRSGL